jgi:hypothetical protein
VSDSDLRRALLGTWRLVSHQFDVDGALVKSLGDNPQGYLVYTPDDHVFVQMATRDERGWPGPEMLELPPVQRFVALGFQAYCGTFEVHDGQAFHHTEFGVLPSWSGNVQQRSVALDGDRLILRGPGGGVNEWQQVHTDGEP